MKCEPDNPGRCGDVSPSRGQCEHIGIVNTPSGPRCEHHRRAPDPAIKAEKRNYRLTKFQARVDEFADNEQAKSLREELGLTRLMIEELVNQCKNETDLLIMSSRISVLISQCEKLVNSCHKLEAATGMMLDKNSILQLASVLVEIISTFITEEDVLALISEKIIAAIVSAQPALPERS